jgi:large subunit ribosomal protein L18
MDRLSDKWRKHTQRKKRVRKKLQGTAERPRLSVYRSHKNISVQAIDDINGNTIASVSTLEKELADVKRSVDGGKIVGQKIAERLKSANITKVVFDRNGYLYHGIVKAIADGAREAGLEF